MSKQNKKQKPLGVAAMAVAFAFGQTAFAHTGIENSFEDGEEGINYLKATHTCTSTSQVTRIGDATSYKKLPMIGQAAVFPVQDDAAVLTDTSDNTHAAITDGLTLTDIVGTTSLDKLIGLVQSNDSFAAQDEINNDTPANPFKPEVIGFYGKQGKVPSNLYSRVPFWVKAPSFKTTGPGACVDTLNIKVAVADICKIAKKVKDGDVNLWIPNNTTIFTRTVTENGQSSVQTFDGSSTTARGGEPATLTITRKTSLGNACVTAGGSLSHTSVDVWPSDAHVDKYLNIPKYWTPTKP